MKDIWKYYAFYLKNACTTEKNMLLYLYQYEYGLLRENEIRASVWMRAGVCVLSRAAISFLLLFFKPGADQDSFKAIHIEEKR